jgi:predicted acyltransferase
MNHETSRSECSLAATAAHDRVVAIDALRGFDMFWIMGGHGLVLALVAAMSSTKEPPEWLKTQMQHTHWVGFSAWDLINPLFLFISGASMAFAFKKHLASGKPYRVMYRRMAARFVLLWIFGTIVQGDLLKLDWAVFRPFTNVLQTIACGYVVTGLMVLHVPRQFQPWITAALLIAYWLLMTQVPVPGLGAGVLDEDRNLAAWIDMSLLDNHAYKHTVSPGVHTVHYAYFLPIMNFSAIMMLGLYAGQWLNSARSGGRKFLGLLAAGAACLALGWLWSCWFPIIKPLFTSSMVLWASGWSLLLLALCYGVTDVLGWRRWTYPCVVIGANAIFAYMVSHVFDAQISGMSGVLFDGLASHLEPSGLSSVVWSAGYVLIMWFMLWVLYRHKIFWRV